MPLGNDLFATDIAKDSQLGLATLLKEVQDISQRLLEGMRAAPPRNIEGDLRYADGTNWNPSGTGAGLAHYLDGAWDSYQRSSQKSAINGYASLDGSGLVPIAELPSGSGSLLDADLLDGIDSLEFGQLALDETVSGGWTFSNGVTLLSDINLTGDIIVSGTVDGRHISEDGVLLDGTGQLDGAETVTGQWTFTDDAHFHAHIHSYGDQIRILRENFAFNEYSLEQAFRAQGTQASPTAITTGQTIYILEAQGYDGAAYQEVAQILYSVEGTVSSGVVPGLITISTADSFGVLTEALHIDSSQGAVFAGDITISNSLPRLYLTESDQGVNEKTWRAYVSGGTFGLATMTDAGNFGEAALVITRTGTTIDLVRIPNGDLSVINNILVTGTVDGRDIATDGTKLDGIETGATADQTKADIDALGIDADTLDSYDSVQFAVLAENETITGTWTISNSNPHLKFTDTDTSTTGRIVLASNDLYLQAPDVSGGDIMFSAYNGNDLQGDVKVKKGGAFATLWHSANGGTGSGLDADLLDGSEGAAFGKLASANSWTQTQKIDTINEYTADNGVSIESVLMENGTLSAPNNSKVRANRSATQSISHATATVVQYNNEDFDTNDEYDYTTTWRFTASENGYYKIHASVMFASTSWTAGQTVYLQIAKNGSGHKNLFYHNFEDDCTTFKYLQGTDLVYLAATDYIEIKCYQGSGSAVNIYANALYNVLNVLRIP